MSVFRIWEVFTDMKKKKLLKTRLTLLSIIPVLAAGLLLVILYAIVTSSKYMTFYRNEGIALARSYASAVEYTINSLSQQFDVVTKNSAVIDESKPVADRKAVLADIASTSTFNDFSIAYSSGKTYNDTDISAREYFQQAIATRGAYISSPVLRMTDNTITIMMGKLFSGNGQDYVVYGGLGADTFSNLIRNFQFESNGICYIIDQKGIVVGTSSSNVEQLADLSDESTLGKSVTAATKKMLAGGEGATSFELGGANYIVGYAQVSTTEGWIIVAATPSAPISNSIVKACLMVMAIALLCAITAYFVTGVRIKRIAGPIAATSERLEAMADGDLSSPTERFATNDEIETMSTSMEKMVSNIRACITDISRVLTAVSHGDLTVRTGVAYHGDFAEIENAINLILDSLNSIISDVNRSSGEVTHSATQLAEGSSGLSNGAIAQAAAVDEMTSTVQSMAQKTAENEEKVQHALAITRNTDELAHDGTQNMSEMLDAIREIEATSQKIETINKVVEDIAFQTNILALNAAVEAARAGEAGKGFAVVADEVRNLASRSAEASQQSRGLIGEAIAAVQRGTGLADTTSQALESIVEGVDQVSTAIRGIAEFNTEQNVAVQQISEAMDNINAAIHKTTATAEESAAESSQLSSLAADLRNAVSHFKTNG